ncbi:MAG: hypothetical protein OXH04_10430 [Acidobacteria bacterium]|nr:hypothetical protein [Acidobacteriota bacterium]
MKVHRSVRSLDTPDDWSHLADALGGRRLDVVRNTLRHLRVLNTKSYVLEYPYIDRDYTADYLQFYARTFRSHERHCKRVHFFDEDVSPHFSRPLSTDRLARIQRFANTHYCGFCVIRPLSTAPIGRTVLTARVGSGFNMEATVTCRADFAAHLLGIDLAVTGTSFLQQDSRVGACAQVAIWAGMRHMHARYNHNWVSVADVTRFATPTTATEAVSLPAGSDFLTSERMIRAISEAGYQPLCFRGQRIDRAILPYVESGIPVILGLNVGGTVGHAVTVIGRVFARQDNPTDSAIDYIPAYIVHDDQGGPYMWLPMDREASAKHSFTGDTTKRETHRGVVELNVREHAVFAVALMPTRVFSTAEAAEHSAWDRIDATLRDMPQVRRTLIDRGLPVNVRLLDELQSAHASGRIVLRTYLTSAAGYRRHLARGSASDDLKDALLDLHLPHFTWITEISTIDSYNQFSPSLRRIYGHTVLDATSTGKRGDGLLVLHLPGLLVTTDINAREDAERLAIITADRLYECREKRL